MSEHALVPLTTLDVDDGETTKRTGQLLKYKGGLFPADMTEAQAAALARLSLLYRLDALAAELTLFQGHPYLTLLGAVRVANDHPKFRGMTCDPATPEERAAFRARDDEELWIARVYRSDRDFPAVGYGRASATDDQPVARRWTQEQAQARAKRRALRDAFSLPVPGAQEPLGVGDVDEPEGPTERRSARLVVDGEAREVPEPIRTDQIVAIHAIARALGWVTKEGDDTPYRDALMATFGVATSKDLTAQQAAAFIEVLVREQEHMIVEDAPARPLGELRSLIARMDDGEAPNWPTPPTETQRLRLRSRAQDIGMTDLQLGGLIATQYGEGTGLEHLDAAQLAALLALLSSGELTEAESEQLPW